MFVCQSNIFQYIRAYTQVYMRCKCSSCTRNGKQSHRRNQRKKREIYQFHLAPSNSTLISIVTKCTNMVNIETMCKNGEHWTAPHSFNNKCIFSFKVNFNLFLSLSHFSRSNISNLRLKDSMIEKTFSNSAIGRHFDLCAQLATPKRSSTLG